MPEPDGYTYINVPFDCGEVSLTRTVSKLPFLPANMEDREDYCEMILTIQSSGLAKRIESSHSAGGYRNIRRTRFNFSAACFRKSHEVCRLKD